MDELRHRAQALLEHPPIAPLPIDELRARARQVRRRQRLTRAALALVAVLVLVVAAVTLVRPTHDTVKTVGPSPSSSIPPTTASAPGPEPASDVDHLPPHLAFGDDLDGWMASGGSCSSGSCADPVLRHSSDGGQTWVRWSSVPAVQDVTLDPTTQRDLGGLVILAFADPHNGWFSQAGQLWSTHDGGHTWHHVASDPVLAIATWGESTAALVARCDGSAPSTGPGRASACPLGLVVTASDRDEWTQSSDTLATAQGGELLNTGGVMWALVAGHLYRTELGHPVQEVSPPCADQNGLGAERLLGLAVGRVGVLCVAGAVDGNTNTMTKVVVESSDDGAHWSVFGVAPATGWAGWATANFGGAAFVVTDGHTLWRSTGGDWTPVFRPPAATAEISQVLMANERVGYVVADGTGPDGTGPGSTIWVSSDGGQTWGPVPLS